VKRFLTVDEAADELGVSRATIYRALAPRGDLPAIRLQAGAASRQTPTSPTGAGHVRTSGGIRIRREDFEAWQERHCTRPAVEARPMTARSIRDLPGATRFAH